MNLDKCPNLVMKVRKADGQRHLTTHHTGDVGKSLADCNSPEEIAKYAEKFGIRRTEIEDRAKSAPNFGQFRMVLGNRIRNIATRKKDNPGWTYERAAYPAEFAKKERAEKIAAKKTAKAKTPKAEKPKAVKKTAPRKKTAPVTPATQPEGSAPNILPVRKKALPVAESATAAA